MVHLGKTVLVSIGAFISVSSVSLADQAEYQAQRGWSTTSCDQHENDGFSCVRYVRNYDGDTVTFDIPSVHPIIGDEISVRVKGIDTAELRTSDDCEKNAAELAQREVATLMANAKRVDLVNTERGKYFRVLADIYVDGESLADQLLKKKLAVRYEGGTKPDVDWCGR